jgi:hypothetical protein
MGRLLSAEALLAVFVRKSNHKDAEDTEKNEMLYFFPLCPLCLCGDSLPFQKAIGESIQERELCQYHCKSGLGSKWASEVCWKQGREMGRAESLF